MFEDGGKRKRVVDALLLHLAVDGGEASSDGSGGNGTVRYGCHLVGLVAERVKWERESKMRNVFGMF